MIDAVSILETQTALSCFKSFIASSRESTVNPWIVALIFCAGGAIVRAIAMSIVALEISETVSFLALNLFEMCVGMYFPIMGTMKGGIVPEDKRAAIYNLYRIPLSCIVLISLLTDLTPRVSFMLNAFMLLTATGLQMILAKRRLDGRQDSPTSPSNEETKPLTLDESAV